MMIQLGDVHSSDGSCRISSNWGGGGGGGGGNREGRAGCDNLRKEGKLLIMGQVIG